MVHSNNQRSAKTFCWRINSIPANSWSFIVPDTCKQQVFQKVQQSTHTNRQFSSCRKNILPVQKSMINCCRFSPFASQKSSFYFFCQPTKYNVDQFYNMQNILQKYTYIIKCPCILYITMTFYLKDVKVRKLLISQSFHQT